MLPRAPRARYQMIFSNENFNFDKDIFKAEEKKLEYDTLAIHSKTHL